MTTTEYGGNALELSVVTAVAPRPVSRRPELTDTTSAIIDELCSAYLGVVPTGVIVQYAGQAVSDLSSSICIEALPEMAIRLARVRLDARIGCATAGVQLPVC
jgi:hypothetical protein